jgi:hypothetical protein
MSDVTTKAKDDVKEALRLPPHSTAPADIGFFDYFAKLKTMFTPSVGVSATFELTHTASTAHIKGTIVYNDGSPNLYFAGSGAALRPFAPKKLTMFGALPPAAGCVGPSAYWFSVTPVLSSCGFYGILGSVLLGGGATDILLPLFGTGHFTLVPGPTPK